MSSRTRQTWLSCSLSNLFFSIYLFPIQFILFNFNPSIHFWFPDSFSGIEVYFIIKFKPQEVREYSLDLLCSTEREKFLVPVRAVSHRPQVRTENTVRTDVFHLFDYSFTFFLIFFNTFLIVYSLFSMIIIPFINFESSTILKTD